MKRIILILVLMLVVIPGVVYAVKNVPDNIIYSSSDKSSLASVASKPVKPATLTLPDACIGNQLDKNIVVILKYQHLWACQYGQIEYSSNVVTGYVGNPADVTPTGTYAIFTKERNVTLTGSDGVTSWNDPVSYWMPFLFNQYGAYGLHDATWRQPNQFGHISTNSPDASHGCIECPLQTAAWIYNWVQVGTTVTIKAT